MPPKQQGPISENTTTGSRPYTTETQSKASGSGSPPTEQAQASESKVTDEVRNDALVAIIELRSEEYTSAVGSGHYRKEYSKVFNFAVLSYWREQSKPRLGLGLGKYKIAQKLQISEKVLKDWISKEDIIVTLQAN